MSLGHARGAALTLIVAQLVHGVVPSPTSENSAVGPIAGVLLLASSIVAVVGIERGWRHAQATLGWTGFAVAAGFVLYHALPWHSPFTRPYFGEPVGAPAWISVGVAVAAGVWAALVGLGRASAEQ